MGGSQGEATFLETDEIILVFMLLDAERDLHKDPVAAVGVREFPLYSISSQNTQYNKIRNSKEKL